MKYICVPSSNRSNYVAQFLSHVRKAFLPDWKVIISQEPTGEVQRVRHMATSVGCTCFVNDQTLGACGNTWRAIELAFGMPDCEAVLQIDDDCMISPDALALCDWYLAQGHSDYDAGICLLNSIPNQWVQNGVTRTLTNLGHVGQGYCYNRSQFESFVKPNFWVRSERFQSNSYDWALGQLAQEGGFIFSRPILSRSKHVGVVGLHGSAAGVHREPFPSVVSESKDKNPSKFMFIE